MEVNKEVWAAVEIPVLGKHDIFMTVISGGGGGGGGGRNVPGIHTQGLWFVI